MDHRLRSTSSLASLNTSAPSLNESPFSTPALTYASSISPPSPAPPSAYTGRTSRAPDMSFASFNSSLSSGGIGGTGTGPRTLRRQQSSMVRPNNNNNNNNNSEFLPNLPQRSGSWQTLESALPDTRSHVAFPSGTTSKQKSQDYGSFNVLDDLPPLSTPQRGIRRSASSAGLSMSTNQWQVTANQQPFSAARRSSSQSSDEDWNEYPPLESASPDELQSNIRSSSLYDSSTSYAPSQLPTLHYNPSMSTTQRTTSTHPRSRAARSAMAAGEHLSGTESNDMQHTLQRKRSFVGLSSCTVPEPTSAQYSSTFGPGRAPPSPADLQLSGSTYTGQPYLPRQNGMSLRPRSPSPMKSMPALRAQQNSSTGYADLSMGTPSMGYAGMSAYDSMGTGYGLTATPRKSSRMASYSSLTPRGGSLSQYEGSGWS